MKHALLILMLMVISLGPSAVSAQTNTTHVASLSQKTIGRAMYRSCDLAAGVYYGTGSLSLRCAFNVNPPRPDLFETRQLNEKEEESLVRLMHASKLYDGGHTGRGTTSKNGMTPSAGTFETLTVYCCERPEYVILVTSGNDTFEAGTDRHRLLQQLHDWQEELTKVGEKKLRR